MTAVPEFVTRGLDSMTRPRSLDGVHYRTEADLRDALASTWWLHGWNVRVEVKVPSCGRIDVLATSANSTVIVEMKKVIKTATQARQAFQQAHAYLSFMQAGGSEVGQNFTAFVTAGDYEWGALEKAWSAYGEIDFLHFTHAAGMAYDAAPTPFGITATALTAARDRAALRARELQTLADAARHADIYSTLAREDVPA